MPMFNFIESFIRNCTSTNIENVNIMISEYGIVLCDCVSCFTTCVKGKFVSIYLER
jgi:hypothetical protein